MWSIIDLSPLQALHGTSFLMVLLLLFSSDKPGNHNFELLKKLVLPDGSVLRAQLPGRPTRDCLFADTARDGTRSAFFSIISLQPYNGLSWASLM